MLHEPAAACLAACLARWLGREAWTSVESGLPPPPLPLPLPPPVLLQPGPLLLHIVLISRGIKPHPCPITHIVEGGREGVGALYLHQTSGRAGKV